MDKWIQKICASVINLFQPFSIPCFTWMPEKKVSKLSFKNDNAPLYLVGINPSDNIKSSKDKWDKVDKLQVKLSKLYKEMFVEKHDHKKIKDNVNMFQILACIKQIRSNGDITTLLAVTYQMGKDKETFIHWFAVSNSMYNDNITSCRRIWFGDLILTTLLWACSIDNTEEHSMLYLQLDESNLPAYNFP